MPITEKRPGADWEVRYQDIETGEIESMSVFGAADIEAAIADARQSLTAGELFGIQGAADWFEIVSVVRNGIPSAS